MTNILKIVNQYGIPFNVKISDSKGELFETYGNIVEFYDARFTEKFGEYGQFVSSYYTKTLLEREGGGLMLDGGIDNWRVSEGNMKEVYAWLKNVDKLINI